MSSRELVDELFGVVTETDKDGKEWLVSASFLPDLSAFNTAVRSGDWSDEQYRQALIINEIRGLRWDSTSYTPDYVRSPAQEKAEQNHQDWLLKRHDENLAQLRGEE